MELLISEVQKRSILWNKWHSKYRDRSISDREWNAVAKNTKMDKEEAKKKWRSLRDTFLKEKKKVTKSRSGDPQECVEIYIGRWNYYNSLLFLKDTTTPRRTEDNVSVCEEERRERDSEVSENENNSDIGNNYVNDDNDENISSLIDVCDIENPLSVSQSDSSNLASQVTNSTSNSIYSLNHSQVRPKKRTKKSEDRNFEKELLQIETQKLNALLQSNNTTTPIADDDDMLFLKSLHPYFKNMPAVQKLRIRNQFQSTIINELSMTQVQPITNASTYNITNLLNNASNLSVTPQVLRPGQFNEDYINFD